MRQPISSNGYGIWSDASYSSPAILTPAMCTPAAVGLQPGIASLIIARIVAAEMVRSSPQFLPSAGLSLVVTGERKSAIRPAFSASSNLISADEKLRRSAIFLTGSSQSPEGGDDGQRPLTCLVLSAAHDDVPAPHAPIGDETVCDVRIVFGEARRDRCIVGTKHQGSTIHRIRKGSGHNKLAVAISLLDQSQMLRSKRCAAVDEIVDDFV